MPSDAVRRQILIRYQRQIAATRTRAAAVLVAAWDGLGSHREADIGRFERRVQAPLAAAKVATVATAVAVTAILLDAPPPSIPAAAVPTAPDLRQPFTAAWHALQMDRPWDEAFQVGRSVSEAVGFDFVQHTARRTGDEVARATDRDVRWQRIPGPTACPWCFEVAGLRYRTAESADFGHERCDCDVVPAA